MQKKKKSSSHPPNHTPNAVNKETIFSMYRNKQKNQQEICARGVSLKQHCWAYGQTKMIPPACCRTYDPWLGCSASLAFSSEEYRGSELCLWLLTWLTDEPARPFALTLAAPLLPTPLRSRTLPAAPCSNESSLRRGAYFLPLLRLVYLMPPLSSHSSSES